MFIKTITYTDFNDVERTEEFYFNLTEAEVIEWLTTNTDATISDVLDNMRRKSDLSGLLGSVKDLIYRAYGEKSPDGRRFIKTPEVKASFMETNAYSILFMELATDAKKAAEFLNNVIPADMAKRIKKLSDEHPNATPEELKKLAMAQQKATT